MLEGPSIRTMPSAKGDLMSREPQASLAFLVGLSLSVAVCAMPSSPASAKTHDVAMTAVETDVVIDGSGE
jgi:hypothetical protein